MNYGLNLRRILLIVFATFALTACATQQKTKSGQLQSDVYTGTDTVKFFSNWGKRQSVFCNK